MFGPLLEKHKDHTLIEIGLDIESVIFFLIYRIDGDVLVLTLARTGSHSDLFGK